MAYAIDPRLLECDGEMEIGTNFNRVLALVDEKAEAFPCEETTAGTYVYTCTIDAEGKKTYAWVEQVAQE